MKLYMWVFQQMCRVIPYLRRYGRRQIEKAAEERAQKIVADETPKVFWAGFGLAVLVGLSLLSAAYASRQLR